MLGTHKSSFSHVVSIEALMITVTTSSPTCTGSSGQISIYVLNLLSCALSMRKKTCRKPGDFFFHPKTHSSLNY